jgi:hypothetical protein
MLHLKTSHLLRIFIDTRNRHNLATLVTNEMIMVVVSEFIRGGLAAEHVAANLAPL